MTIHKVFLQSIFKTLLFRCDACSKFLAVSNVSDKECLTKVKEHWARAHNVSCAPRYTQVTCLGYTCAHDTCTELLRSGEETLAHFYDAHPEVDAANMRITDIKTGDILELGGVFRWAAPCPLTSCPWRQEHRSHQLTRARKSSPRCRTSTSL